MIQFLRVNITGCSHRVEFQKIRSVCDVCPSKSEVESASHNTGKESVFLPGDVTSLVSSCHPLENTLGISAVQKAAVDSLTVGMRYM